MIIVVGSLNLDLVSRVARLPEPGETLLAEGYSEHEGGKGANQAVAAARLGNSQVAMIGWVGHDEAGDRLTKNLASAGVNTTHVRRTKGPTGRALIEVDANGANRIVVVPGANHLGRPADLANLPGAEGDWLLLQREVPTIVNQEAIRIARQRGLRIALNPAPSDTMAETEWHGVDLCVANEHETASMLNWPPEKVTSDLPAAARAIRNQGGVAVAVVTAGSLGVAYSAEHEEGEIPAFAVPAIDTTAAGDTFVGALVANLSTGATVHASAQFAAAAAAIAVTREGAQPSIPSRAEVEEFKDDRKGQPTQPHDR